ncbi:hypothetical protein FV242_28850 [Methylobacterium sp. WL64]|uniref:hypothetical protein n=1 Tax=Methylobacterium sp. WL64 TaxID=2603894 RepID=UPI0011CA2001|nr:hypothetical protein [Methylobacterium sp. WL64]TXM98404.1 hypothetical protein FV242_28850 [Methylobacterium sp. WL64]
MSAPASRRDDLTSLIFDMEDAVRNLVRWGQAVRAMGCSGCDVEAGALYVVGDAMVEAAVKVERLGARLRTVPPAAGGRTMSIACVDWGQILALEDDIMHLDRLANVLTTLGTHDDVVHRECIYVMGCMLSQIGKRLEANYGAIKPIRDGRAVTAFTRLGVLAGHVVGFAWLGRRVLLAWLAHRDLQRAKVLLRRSDRRFAASGLFAVPVTASGVPRVCRS